MHWGLSVYLPVIIRSIDASATRCNYRLTIIDVQYLATSFVHSFNGEVNFSRHFLLCT